jgi:hypothetical protein
LVSDGEVEDKILDYVGNVRREIKNKSLSRIFKEIRRKKRTEKRHRISDLCVSMYHRQLPRLTGFKFFHP